MESSTIELGSALNNMGGFSRFQYRLLLQMMPTSVTGVLTVNVMTYIMPAIACELKIPKTQQGLLFSSVYIGMVVGGLIWGVMADIIGRRLTLLVLISTTAFFEIATAFTFSYWDLFLWKVCAGFMSAGIMTTSYTYVSEFVSSKDKDKMVMSIGMVTAFGYFIQPFFAIFTLPLTFRTVIIPNILVLTGWKTFVLICAIFPTISFLILICTLHESPAFLIRRGRHEDAVNVLRKIYVTNTKNPPETFTVKKLRLPEDPRASVLGGVDVKPTFTNQLVMLIRYPYLAPLTIVCLCQFISMTAFAGVRSHIATVITLALGVGQEVESKTKKNLPFCELFDTQVIFRDKVNCDNVQVKLNPDIYICTTIIGFFIVASFLPITKFVKKIGKPKAFVFLHYVAAVSIFVVPFAEAYYAVAILTIFSLCMQNCVTLSVGLILNRIPTTVRGLTVSLVMIGGRIGVICGSMILPLMTKISCYAGFWSIAFLNIISLPLLWLYIRQPNTSPDDVPEMKEKPLTLSPTAVTTSTPSTVQPITAAQ